MRIKGKKSISNRIVEIAESGKAIGMPSKFNLPQNKAVREKHIAICKELVEISKRNGNYPIGTLIYFAIGTNSHRTEVFEKCYRKIDTKKAETIISWIRLFAEYNDNPKMVKNAKIAHAICSFYEKNNGDTKAFKIALGCSQPNPAIESFKETAQALGIAKESLSEAEAEMAVVTVE